MEQTTQQPEIGHLIEKIDKLIGTMSMGQPALWGINEIAAYLGLSPQTIKQTCLIHPEFPRAINPIGSAKGRRWKPNEVIAWAERRREALPKARVRTRSNTRQSSQGAGLKT